MNFTVCFQNCKENDAKIILNILNQRLKDRNAHTFTEIKEQSADLLYVVNPAYAKEEYSIYNHGETGIVITADSLIALLFGTGKMLRTAVWGGPDGFAFGKWRGRTAPKCEWRIAYLSNHLFNTFHVASKELVLKYIEDVVLLGYNTYNSSCGVNSYPSWDDPRIPEHIARLQLYYQKARSLGMKLSGSAGSNCVKSGAPEINKAQKTGLAQYGDEVCPSSPNAIKILLDYKEALSKLIGYQPYDLLNFWPYDQGGCGCPKCAPWGCNGYLKMCEAFLPYLKEKYPNAKLCISTWLFDFPEHRGEWEGLYQYIQSGKGKWIDVILADSHTEFPKYPLEHPIPNGIKLLTFPEISMLNRYPWGGFGANPMPERFSRLWAQPAEQSCGGKIYSEGIYEDFNKALYASFFWNGNNEVEEVIREYANYEFGMNDTASLTRLIQIFEQNHQEPLRWFYNKENRTPVQMHNNKIGWSSVFAPRNDTAESLQLCEKIEFQQSEWAKKCWRWRIFALRAQLDHIINETHGDPSREIDIPLRELFSIYQLDPARDTPVTPMTEEWVANQETNGRVKPVVDDVLPDDLKKK